MHEVKKPKKSLLYYYVIVLLVLMLFNALIMPMIVRNQVVEVDYGTFMRMSEENDVGLVQIENNQITFTDKAEEKVFKTGRMADDGLVERLYQSGAKFSSEIVEETSPC